MDDWDGVILANKLSASGPLPWADAMPVFSRICDALGHAHRHGVIHRDLCPGNYADALDCLHRCVDALAKCKREGESDGMAVMAQITLADCYSESEDLEQAEHTLKVALYNAKQNEFKVYQNLNCKLPDEIFCKLVGVCKKENKISQAQSYARQYLDYCLNKYGKVSLDAGIAAKLVSSLTSAGTDPPASDGVEGKKK